MLEVGKVFAERYEVLAKIGEGGMGAVYKVCDVQLDLVCALKLLSTSMVADKENRDRFLREGKSMSRVSHKNVASVFRLGVEQVPYLIMEYLEGASVRRLLQNQEFLPQDFVLDLISQVCEGMSAVHNNHILHRDIKPDNIFVVPVEGSEKFVVKILDFGLARFSTAEVRKSQHLTQTGALIGSVHYMSPEQCIGQRVDERSDIYSLGCVMFECLSGHPPYDADSAIGLLHKHMHDDIPALPAVEDRSNLVLNEVIAKTLAKAPAQRYQSMQEFHDALRKCREIDSTKCLPVEKMAQARKAPSKMVLGWIAASAILGLLFANVWQWKHREDSLPFIVRPQQTLSILEADLARSRRLFDQGSSQDKYRTAKSLYERISDVREEYWLQSNHEKWFGLAEIATPTFEYLPDGKSLHERFLCENYHRCYGLTRLKKDEAQKQLWKTRELRCLQELEELVNTNQMVFSKVNSDVVHCMQYVREGRFRQARVPYDSGLAAIRASLSPVSDEFFFGGDEQNWGLRIAESWLYYLIQHEYCRTAQDALDFSEMITPLAVITDSKNTRQSALKARACAKKTLRRFFPIPPSEPELRLRYDKVMRALGSS
ncbi:MAG: serine/threonine protein kinase [Candidatus Obscuribacterales bacterium]|nr:serine/threonine protein kinase [Candidatus Obscuribacterales bacterium]